ncbi:EamA family transporter [Streptomyces sp. HSW2009]|uniref:EamA family transporter n=1 Tax=Streptomyces sp. HSW2009 TaxID=3142890 RepID=UPI0032EC8788
MRPGGSGRRAAGGGSLVGLGLVAGGLAAQQFGAAVAASLFPRAGALGVVTLRLTVAALVLLVVCRPAVRGHRRADWAVIAGFGAALAGMNALIYQAIDRIPLGAAVTLEVLGPLTLSVLAARGARRWLWAGLALAGVALLGRGGFDGLDPVGAGFALAAGAAWAAYILLSARTGSRFPGVDGLALAMAFGALLSLPFGVADAGGALLDPVTVGLGAAVALLSSVLPYTLELLALRRIAPATFSVLMSLAPAVAALAGQLVLGQALSPTDVAAIALVVLASAGAIRAAAGLRSEVEA